MISEPTSSAAVEPPFGLRQLTKPTTSSSTLATPGVDSTACRSRPDSNEGSSKLLVPSGDDPQVGLGLVEHGGDAVLGAEVDAELHRHQHDREDDADQRHDQAQAIMEQIAIGELGDHRHGLAPLAGRDDPAGADGRWCCVGWRLA